MKLISFFSILFFLISCEEKNLAENFQLPKIEITEEGKIIPIDSTKLANIKDSNVVAFYGVNQNKTFWLADSLHRQKIIALLNNVKMEGLFSEYFDLKNIQTEEKNIDILMDVALVDYDIILTENLSRFIKKATKGSLNPKKLYTNWDLKENNVNFTELLLNFQKKDSFNWALKRVIPHHIVYKRLKDALKIIYSLPKEEFVKIEQSSKIVLNDTNVILPLIKKKLIYWKDLKPKDNLTPFFDQETELAIKKFQMRHGLAPDGIIGVGTIMALNFSKEKRKEQIIANMERWRWYPRKFEREYLIINIPDYKLHAIRNNDTLQIHKVIVGRAKRKTPVLSSRLTHLVFNPTWTVPPTILRKDVLPKAKRDRSYFKRKRITIYDSKKNVVSSMNWQAHKAGSYTYVQSPGTFNSMGLVKFMFPNRFNVYLHDTNSRGFFEKDIRALSSGCIRVQDPFELTEYFLDDMENWSFEKIEKTIRKGKTKEVNFKKDVYIHVLYWTSWSENGKLQFRDDLYNFDVGLYIKLRNKI